MLVTIPGVKGFVFGGLGLESVHVILRHRHLLLVNDLILLRILPAVTIIFHLHLELLVDFMYLIRPDLFHLQLLLSQLLQRFLTLYFIQRISPRLSLSSLFFLDFNQKCVWVAVVDILHVTCETDFELVGAAGLV